MERQFQRLDELLTKYRSFWQFQPFHFTQSRWQLELPELHKRLNHDKPYSNPTYQQDKDRAAYLAPWIAHAQELVDLCKLPMISAADVVFDAALNFEVNGRKWQQIVEFSKRVPASESNVIEWCAGKGHLGRVLASVGHKVSSVEWQQTLCIEGERLSDRAALTQQFYTRDVLQNDCRDLFTENSDAVALHACGELHHRFLQLAVAENTHGLCLSPCCYHLIPQQTYQPFSMAAKQSAITLYKHDLKLPLQETVTAGKRTREQRLIDVAWRLAFDRLQREFRNKDEYLPLPAIPRPLLSTSFKEFCDWAFVEKSLKPTNAIDYARFERIGLVRYEQVQQMEFVQHLFRRPLEIWLLLDKVLFLQQHGYKVEAGIFCDYALTPRNLMIRASQKS